MSMQVRSVIHPLIEELLDSKDLLFSLMRLHVGPVHVGVPAIMAEQIEKLQQVMRAFSFESDVYFAHKATKSPAFIKQALRSGVKLDVASEQEFISGLKNGFRGEDMSCSGPKNNTFLRLAIRHGGIISIDSIDELRQISDIARTSQARQIRILVRISNVVAQDRQVTPRWTKFGITTQELPELIQLFRESPQELLLLGVHCHIDEYQGEVKGGYIADLFQIMKRFYEAGLRPTVMDIGGAWKDNQLANAAEWEAYIEAMTLRIKQGQKTDTWAQESYGMSVTESGRIVERERLYNRYRLPDYATLLQQIFATTDESGTSLERQLSETMLRVMLEPGYLLMQHAGFSLVRVLGMKKLRTGDTGLVLDANIFNLSSRMYEYIMDPVLISKKTEEVTTEPVGVYLLGNLCREDDLLVKRKVFFPTQPQTGDLICFLNTAGYSSSFEDGHPIMQASGKTFVLDKQGSDWQVWDEHAFYPQKT